MTVFIDEIASSAFPPTIEYAYWNFLSFYCTVFILKYIDNSRIGTTASIKIVINHPEMNDNTNVHINPPIIWIMRANFSPMAPWKFRVSAVNLEWSYDCSYISKNSISWLIMAS